MVAAVAVTAEVGSVVADLGAAAEEEMEAVARAVVAKEGAG